MPMFRVQPWPNGVANPPIPDSYVKVEATSELVV